MIIVGLEYGDDDAKKVAQMYVEAICTVVPEQLPRVLEAACLYLHPELSSELVSTYASSLPEQLDGQPALSAVLARG
ncbi:hypothetical protein FIV42_23195 [Persicimonas caeni]|uniref:Uncharacterized protein n=1 Tax=Persicimonas caeni TaxID=2292766 RepID=A0A4Y6PYZ5_PERCE|nr:hypothetical protein [Persicimonas caeni]QDG53541.1 hypothetical protein FIV42_23195 [Persicimonas caeni]QED34762.1 hypothetical protein FRD00_23190 [Persicimonas caeni]